MEIIGLIVMGAIVGFIARLLLPGPDPMGAIGTILVGIVGSILGYYIASAITPDNEGFPWIGALIATMILVWLYRKFAGRRTVT